MPVEAPQRPPSFKEALAKEMAPLEAQLVAEGKATAAQAPAAKPPDDKPPTQQPPKQETPASTEDLDREIESGKRSPKSEDFKRVKTAASEFRKKYEEAEPKLKQYEQELTELKKQPKHNAELIKQITEERDRYKGMFEQVAVEISPEFHAKYKTRLDSVKAGLPQEHADKLMSLLTLPDSEVKRKHLAELTSEMDEFQVAEIVAANREVRTILNERQGELTKAQESLTKIGEERTKKQQERMTALEKTFGEVITKAQSSNPVFQSKEGDEAWNKSVQERTAVAKAIFNGDFESDSERAEAALWASAAPEFLSQLKAVTSELAEARSTIEKLKGSTPALNGAGAPGATGRAQTFAEKVNADMRGGA